MDVHTLCMLNSNFLDHRSSKEIHFSDTCFKITLNNALLVCGKHCNHTHSAERKHSRREKEK